MSGKEIVKRRGVGRKDLEYAQHKNKMMEFIITNAFLSFYVR